MSTKDLSKMMKDLQINNNLLSEQDKRLLMKGGYQVSDSSESSINQSLDVSNQQRYKQRFNNQQYIIQQQNYDNIQQNNQQIVQSQQQQIEQLKNQNKQLQNDHEQKIKTLQNDFQIQQNKANQEFRNIKNKTQTNDNNFQLIKQAISQLRDMAHGISGESQYLQLKNINDDNLHPSEQVLVQCWEIIKPIKNNLELVIKDIQGLRTEVQNQQDKSTNLLSEIEHLQRMNYEKDEDYKRRVFEYECSRKQFQLELQDTNNQLSEQNDKINEYNNLEKNYNYLKLQHDMNLDKLQFFDSQKMENAQGHVKLLQDSKIKIELLEQDKQHLAKENLQHIEKHKNIQDRCDFLEKQFNDVKSQNQSYLQQLLSQKNDGSFQYETRINKEITEMKEKQHRELELTKTNLVDIYEKQIRFLKDQKEEVEIKSDSVQNQLKEKQFSYDQLLIENRTLMRQIDSDMCDLRLSLRLKSEDNERLKIIQDDIQSNIKSYKMENEMLREKLNILKSEFYKQESNQKEDYTQMKAQLAVAKEQLSNYESIENEIDEAIVGLGGGSHDQDNIYLNTLQTAPTSSKRRIQQALSLAKRLQHVQKDNENLIQQNQQLKEQIEECSDDLKVAKSILDKSQHPYGYLITAVEEKEKEIIKYKQLLRKMEIDYEQLKKESQEFQFANQQSQQDIQKLLIKRENIHNIQKLLVGLVQNKGNITDLQKNVIDDINNFLQAGNQQEQLSFIPEKQSKNQNGYNWAQKLRKQ